MHINIPAPPHYRLAAMIDAHGGPQLLPFRWDEETQVLHRVELLARGTVVQLRIAAAERRLDVDIAGSELGVAEQQELEQAVRWIVALDEDFGDFYEFCSEH